MNAFFKFVTIYFEEKKIKHLRKHSARGLRDVLACLKLNPNRDRPVASEEGNLAALFKASHTDIGDAKKKQQRNCSPRGSCHSQGKTSPFL